MLSKMISRYNHHKISIRIDPYIEYLIRNSPGGIGMRARKMWYQNKFNTCGSNLRVLPGAFIINPNKVACGDNFFVGINNYIQAGGGLICGSNVMMGPYAKIWTHNHVFSDPNIPIWQQGYDAKEVVIGDDVWIGANALIMPGAKIGNRAIISACSVVGAKNYPDGIILSGNPARKIGAR